MLTLIQRDYFATPLDTPTAVAIPAGATAVKIICMAGGAGGGGATVTTGIAMSCGSGGGAGGRSQTWLLTLPAGPFTWQAGSGGAGVSGANGALGLESFVKDNAGNYLCRAQGGGATQYGGVCIAAITPGGCAEGGPGGNHDGAFIVADISTSGPSGGAAMIDTSASPVGRVGQSGWGGTSPDGAGGGTAISSAGAGIAGGGRGAGGGGALAYSGFGPFAGGNGSSGYVSLEWWG